MYLLEKRADKINGDDIKRLIEIYYKENKSLDYKKELNLNQDKDKKELLFDITVMYNTDGGATQRSLFSALLLNLLLTHPAPTLC